MQTRSHLKQYFAAFIEALGSAILFPLLWIVVHVRIPGKNFRKPLSTVLIGTGAILIFYVAGSYYSSYRAQRSLMKQWQQANSEDSWSGPALSRISIPKIGLDAVIVEGTNRRSLSKGPGHLLSTVLPGERGNAVIAGHRDTFFRRLSELIPGDDIFIRQGGESYHFVVFRKRVVTPDDISVLRTGSRSILTLITCFPMTYIGPAPQRLIIEAHLAAASQPVI